MTAGRARRSARGVGAALLGGLLAGVPGDAARAQDSLRISQVVAQLPQVTVYADILDRTGRATAVRPAQLSARVGERQATVASVTPFRSSRDGVAYIFLVDVSRSLDSTRFAEVRSALALWIDGMRQSDRAAILTFGEAVRTAQDFTGDKKRLKAAVSALEAADRNTELYRAIATAMGLSRRADPGLPGRRVVVLLSDGLDDATSGYTSDEALGEIEKHKLPLYAMGYRPARPSRAAEAGLRTLGVLARRSGGAYAVVDAEAPIEEAYTALRTLINRVSVVRLTCEDCAADGAARPVELQLTTPRARLTDVATARMTPAPPPPPKPFPWVVAGLIALGVLVAALGLYLVLSRPKAQIPAAGTEGEVVPAEPLEPQQQEAGDGGWGRLLGLGASKEHKIEEPHHTAAAGVITVPKRPRGPSIAVRLAVLGRDGRAAPELRTVDVSGEHVIGRNPDAELSFPNDPKMSGRHCALTLEQGMVHVRDLKSKNGTLVNGVPINPAQRLEEGDVIRAGDTELRVSFVHAGIAVR